MIKKIYHIGNGPTVNGKKMEYNVNTIIKEISSLQAEQEEQAVIDYLYKMYKGKNYHFYIIGRKEFERFLKTMLPIYFKEYKNE